MGGEITILDETPDTYQIIQKDVNKTVGVTIHYTLPWESESATIHKNTAQVVDIDKPPRFISSFEDVRITEGAIYEKDFEFTDDEYFTGTNNYLKVTGKYLLDGSEITIPTYKRYNIVKNASDEMIITDENGDEVGDIILTVGVKYSFIVDKTFYDSYGFEIYKQETGTDTARDTIIGYGAGAPPGPHESDLTKYNINLYFSEFPETGEDTLYFGSAFTSILNLGRKEFSLQYSPIILRAGGSGLNALEYKLIAVFNKDEMDNITVDGINNVLPVTLTVSDTPIDEGSTPQTVEATFNITVDNIHILNNVSDPSKNIVAAGTFRNHANAAPSPMNEMFDGDKTTNSTMIIEEESEMPSIDSSPRYVLGQRYGAISIDLGKSYPLHGVRIFHTASSTPTDSIPIKHKVKRVQFWYSTSRIDSTNYQYRDSDGNVRVGDSSIEDSDVSSYDNVVDFDIAKYGGKMNYYAPSFKIGEFILKGSTGYKYFYFNKGFNLSYVSNVENKQYNSQIYARYLHVKIIEVYDTPDETYTTSDDVTYMRQTLIPTMDFILNGSEAGNDYLFDDGVFTINNVVNHQIDRSDLGTTMVILPSFSTDIKSNYNINVGEYYSGNFAEEPNHVDKPVDQPPYNYPYYGGDLESDGIINVEDNEITLVGVPTSDYTRHVIVRLENKANSDDIIVQIFSIYIRADAVSVTRALVSSQIMDKSQDFTIEQLDFVDDPEAKQLIYEGYYKNEDEVEWIKMDLSRDPGRSTRTLENPSEGDIFLFKETPTDSFPPPKLVIRTNTLDTGNYDIKITGQPVNNWDPDKYESRGIPIKMPDDGSVEVTLPNGSIFNTSTGEITSLIVKQEFKLSVVDFSSLQKEIFTDSTSVQRVRAFLPSDSLNEMNNILNDKIYNVKYDWLRVDDETTLATYDISGSKGEFMRFKYTNSSGVEDFSGNNIEVVDEISSDTMNLNLIDNDTNQYDFVLGDNKNKLLKFKIEINVHDQLYNCFTTFTESKNKESGYYYQLEWDNTTTPSQIKKSFNGWAWEIRQRVFNKPEERHINLTDVNNESNLLLSSGGEKIYINKAQERDWDIENITDYKTESEYNGMTESEQSNYQLAILYPYYSYPAYMTKPDYWSSIGNISTSTKRFVELTDDAFSNLPSYITNKSGVSNNNIDLAFNMDVISSVLDEAIQVTEYKLQKSVDQSTWSDIPTVEGGRSYKYRFLFDTSETAQPEEILHL